MRMESPMRTTLGRSMDAAVDGGLGAAWVGSFMELALPSSFGRTARESSPCGPGVRTVIEPFAPITVRTPQRRCLTGMEAREGERRGGACFREEDSMARERLQRGSAHG